MHVSPSILKGDCKNNNPKVYGLSVHLMYFEEKKTAKDMCFFQKCDESKSWQTDVKTCSNWNNPYIFFETNRFGHYFFRRNLDWNASCGYTIFNCSKSIYIRHLPKMNIWWQKQRRDVLDSSMWSCATYSRLSRHKLNYWLVGASGNRGIQHHAKPHLHKIYMQFWCRFWAGFPYLNYFVRFEVSTFGFMKVSLPHPPRTSSFFHPSLPFLAEKQAEKRP